MATVRRAGLVQLRTDRKGTGKVIVTPTQLYQSTFPLRHNTLHTHLQKNMHRDREYTHNELLLTTAHVLPRREGGRIAPTNHSHVLGEADSVFLTFFLFFFSNAGKNTLS